MAKTWQFQSATCSASEVGSGIFKSEDPAKRARAIVKDTLHSIGMLEDEAALHSLEICKGLK